MEAKRLELHRKRELRRLYSEAGTGAVDLFVYFVHRALELLAPSGRLAMVLPNKILVASYARRLRERLLGSCTITDLLVVSRMQLFGAVAVYPVVLALQAGQEGSIKHSVRVHQPLTLEHLNRVPADSTKVSVALYKKTQSRAFFPVPCCEDGSRLLTRLVDSLAIARLADVLDIRWTVSFHRASIRDSFVSATRPESPYAMPFLGGGRFQGNGEVQRYKISWAGWWIDYDEEKARTHKNQIPPLAIFRSPKLVICQNARRMRCAVDYKGLALKDTFLAGLPREIEHPLVRYPEAVVALLNSDVVHFYCSHVFYGGHVGGGYLHFLESFVVDIPLGCWTEQSAKEVATLVAQLSESSDSRLFSTLDEKVQDCVARAFDLNTAERAIVSKYADSR